MDERGAWSAAGAAVVLLAGSNAVAWAVAAASANSPLPTWPAILFGALAIVGLYFVIAPLARLPPFRRMRSVPELLDDCIRDGREVRDRIVREGLEGIRASAVAASWILRVAVDLHKRFPAIADEFMFAYADEGSFSGQALSIQTINAKLAILRDARKGIRS